MLNVHAYLLRKDEKMAATIGFERSLAPPASDAAASSIAQLQRRFLGLAPESAPPWTLRFSVSQEAQLDEELLASAGRSGFCVEICASGVGKARAREVIAQLGAVPNLTTLILRGMQRLMDLWARREGGQRDLVSRAHRPWLCGLQGMSSDPTVVC